MTQEKERTTPKAPLGGIERDVSKDVIYLEPEEAEHLYLDGYQAPQHEDDALLVGINHERLESLEIIFH